MRFSIVVPILVFLTASCVTVQKTESPQEKTVRYVYKDVVFTPDSRKKEINNGVFIEITPIDAIELNERTYRSAMLTGNYERDIAHEHVDRDFDNLSRNEEIIYANKIEADSKIREMINDKEISSDLGNSLIERMWSNESVGRDGSEVKTVSGQHSTHEANPFYHDQRYLSLFEVKIENTSGQIEEFDLGSFQVSSGDEILYPLSIEDFERRFKNNLIKLENAYRYNLPNYLRVSPGQSVKKILATPAIATDNSSVTVQKFDDITGDVYDFEYEISLVSEELEIVFEKFTIKPRMGTQRINYYAVQMEDGTTFGLKENALYSPNDNLDQLITVCYAEIPSGGYAAPTAGVPVGDIITNSKVQCEEFVLSDLKSKEISF